ncbi:TonB-dependent copper receptor [Thauera humireducens]|uniref:TonB-dependent copper receptor n=1 Tax=Thauera humireducens TaxID=1134435 RepID=A0A127K4E4_9RHOO|nr:TonB-dependent copper receptor [Thauera humireducens]AMO36816.1 TonB-dependent copper receptor [Thauera humireducens]
MKHSFKQLPLAVAISLALPALAQDVDTRLDSVVVTAPVASAPLTVTTDPKAPRQPLPAHDGADMLKSIPGFSVIRKGGADGDPVFRGMAGSRLGILQDGQEIHGGCGGRMDPPTAYVYPESFDSVTVLKGPQTVLYGAGNSAGVVLFERDSQRMADGGWSANGSVTLGSWGRNDQVIDAKAGNPDFYARIGATRSDSNNYEDGDGNEVHSFYTRWSTTGALGWTPDDNTLLELNFGRSDGEAAYADRAMDGVRFEREHAGLRFEKRNISSLVRKVEAHAYYSYIDHVMDNFSLRSNRGMRMLNNPDRKTTGARAAVALAPSERWLVTLGADVRDDQHRTRNGVNYRNQPWQKDIGFERQGVFGEASYAIDDARRIVGGLRVDDHEARDYRPTSLTRGVSVDKTLQSGFGRYEADFGAGAGTWYAGVGYVERFPDFWEFMRATPAGGERFDILQPEKTTQLDVGANWSAGPWSASVSGFYGKVDDYILLRWVTSTSAQVRNIDATVYGLEGDVTWRFAPNWKAVGTLAWVRGSNDTDSKALAQQPPLEARLALEYDDRRFSYGAMLRMVSRQNRYDVGSGNIVANGQDLGPTGGFATLSLNAGWRPNKVTLLTAGVDNVFDRNYSEHLGKGGWDFAGGAVTTYRINEPGRTFWLKAQVALD